MLAQACSTRRNVSRRSRLAPAGRPVAPILPSAHRTRGSRQAAAKGCRPDPGFIICRASASKCGTNAPSPSSARASAKASPAPAGRNPESRPMLDAMRRGAVNWLAKILLGLLIIAFAVWGVADVFRGYGRGTLARIGDTEISVDEYRQAYQDEMASISRRLRPPPDRRAGQDAGRRAARAVAPGRHGGHRHPCARAAPGAVRPGHRRHHPRGPGLPGRRRQVLPAHLPGLSCARTASRRAATSPRGARRRCATS